MRWPSLIKVLLATSFVWCFLLGATIWNAWTVLRHAPGYRAAELIVEDASCIGTSRSDNRGPSPPTDCFLDGIVEGERISLNVDGSPDPLPFSVAGLENRFPPGSKVKVHYNPSAPVVGLNHQGIRVLWWSEDLEGEWRAYLAGSLQLVGLSLASVIVLFVVTLWGSQRRTREDGQTLEFDLGKPWHGFGLGVAALGLALLAAQTSGVAVGGVILGLILLAIGASLLIRGLVRIERSGPTVLCGHHLFGWTLQSKSHQLPSPVFVELTGDLPPRIQLVSGEDASSSLELANPGDAEEATSLGERVARFLGTALQDPFQDKRAEIERALQGSEESEDPEGEVVDPPPPAVAAVFTAVRLMQRVVLFAIPLGLVGLVAALVFLPEVRFDAARRIAAPDGPLPMLRGPAIGMLGADGSDETLRLLVHLVAATPLPIDADVGNRALAAFRAAASQRTSPSPAVFADREAAFRWASEHFDRPLDANRGVLGWFEVNGRYGAELDRIASREISDAWAAWESLGLGVLVSPEDFLWALGPALSDPRPIHFAIYGDVAWPNAQPDPVLENPRPVLAHTVGEALAIKLWTYQGVGDEELPEDFTAFWADFATRHQLPPPPRESQVTRSE